MSDSDLPALETMWICLRQASTIDLAESFLLAAPSLARAASPVGARTLWRKNGSDYRV
jgi:hypothetical protein